MKNPFKKTAIVDTLVNVGVGGAANVAMNYVFDNIAALASVAEYKNAIKIGVGVLGGTMVNNKWARAAFDGIATVGASELVSSYLPVTASGESASGVPYGTIGKIRMGQRGFARSNRRVAGVGEAATAFMSK